MTIYDLFYTDVLSDTLYYLCLKTEQVIAVRGEWCVYKTSAVLASNS